MQWRAVCVVVFVVVVVVVVIVVVVVVVVVVDGGGGGAAGGSTVLVGGWLLRPVLSGHTHQVSNVLHAVATGVARSMSDQEVFYGC